MKLGKGNLFRHHQQNMKYAAICSIAHTLQLSIDTLTLDNPRKEEVGDFIGCGILQGVRHFPPPKKTDKSISNFKQLVMWIIFLERQLSA